MLHEAEAAAAEIRREAGARDAAGAVELAYALMGQHAVLVCHRLGRKAAYQPETDSIWVRRDLSPAAVGYLVGHELAERYLVRSGQVLEEPVHEAFCDAVAARLVAPRCMVRAALAVAGDDHAQVAELLGTSQTISLVRMAEETHRPLVAVLPGRVIVRGEEFAWGSEESVRRLSRGPVPDGIVRLPISDAPRRFALAAA